MNPDDIFQKEKKNLKLSKKFLLKKVALITKTDSTVHDKNNLYYTIA